MRKVLVLITVTILLLSVNVSAAEVIITHLAYQHSGTYYHDYLQKKAEEFNKTHPGIKVEIIIGVQDQLATMMAGGVPPDVFDLPDFGYLGPAGQLLDLKPLLERDKLLENYNQAVLRLVTINNAIYTMPSQLNMFLTYFNRELFEQAGLITPDKLGPAWDWDYLIAAGKKMTIDQDGDNQPDVYGFDRAGGAGWRLITVQHGTWFYAFNEKMQPVRSLWNSREVVTAIQTYERVFRERITPHLALPRTEEQKFYFWTGRTAIDIQDQLTAIGNYFKDMPADWDMALQPRGPAGPIALSSCVGPSIFASSKNIEAAWEWVKFHTAVRENAEELARATGGFPAMVSAQHVYPVLTGIENKNYRAIFEQSNYMQPPEAGYPLPSSLNPRMVNMNPVWQGLTPAVNHLEEIHRQMQAIIDEMLAAGN
ncbi:MAG TPA: extracellular solute-binding protein [Firmicutes bacterium]|nr:extracellular solute-binding protein [Bacillota bacterium]